MWTSWRLKSPVIRLFFNSLFRLTSKKIKKILHHCFSVRAVTRGSFPSLEVQKLKTLRWHPNGCDSVSNHQHHHCLLNRLFKCRSKKTSKLRVTGLCAGNSPRTGEFPAQMASNAEMFPFDDVIMICAYLSYGDPMSVSCWAGWVEIVKKLLRLDFTWSAKQILQEVWLSIGKWTTPRDLER